MPDVVALVRDAQKGDLSAFAALYDHYFDRVYRYVVARVGNSHEAEELTQDDIDNGRLIAVVGIAPVKPAEFVIIRIGQKTIEAA